MTIMWLEQIDQKKAFAGEDFEKAVVHPTAEALLKRHDHFSQHFELRHELGYD